MNTFGYRLKKIRKERQLRQKELAKALGLAQTTIANYEGDMRFPDQKKLYKIANYLDVSLDYLLGTDEQKEGLESNQAENKVCSLPEASKEYLRSLLDGDKDRAKKIIKDTLSNGISVSDIYLKVFEPALKEVGSLWSLNKVSIGEEHFCSFVTQQIMAQIAIKNAHSKKYKAIAVAVNGEFHEIGLKMASDFLEMDGWFVYYLGVNTPTQSIIDAIKSIKADILMISVTIPFYLDALENLIKIIKQSKGCENIKILVGGQAFNNNPKRWKEIGADEYAFNAEETIKKANKLIGL